MERKVWGRWLPLVVSAAVLTLALVLLHRELRAYSVSQILAGVRSLPPSQIFGALALTAASYFALTGYDWLAAKYVGADVSYRRLAFASFLSYAFASSLGFPLLTAGPVRFRLYTAWGLDASDVGRLITFTSTTFWLGFFALAGTAFLIDPPGLPDSLARLGGTARPLGAVLLAVSFAYLAWCRWGKREIAIGRWSLPTPTLRLGLGQTLISAADWAAAAGALYVLLPSSLGLSFPRFLSAFLLAQILGLASHVPGGLGVFEIVLLIALGEHAEDSAFVTSLLAYRAVYYLLPLVLAVGALGAFEYRIRKERLDKALGVLGTSISAAVPLLGSGAVFVAGSIMLVEGALPLQGHLGSLGRSAPLALVESSHFLGSVVGACLLILAWGLANRLDGAFHATLALLAAGSLFSVFRGGGLATAAVPLAVLLALAPAKREFFRRSQLTAQPLSPEWVFGVAVVALATVWLGFFAYREVAYTGELWWQFAFEGDAPRFLRSSVGAAAVLLTFALTRLLKAASPVDAAPPAEIPPAVHEVAAASDRSHAQLAFLGDKSFLLSETGRSFIMYAVEGKSWVSMGDPIGESSEFSDLVWQFRSRVHQHGGWAVFYQARPEFLPLYVDQGLTLIKLGEEAVVSPQDFSLEGGHRSGLRYTMRKVEKHGAAFEILPPEATRAALPELKNISDAWLMQKSTREKGFSLGSFDEAYLSRFPTAVVRVNGAIVAFANLWMGAAGTEYSVDLMRFDEHSAPADSMEYLFLKLILWGQEQGFGRFTLGMAPLAGLEGGPLAPMWARLGGAVFRHGEHFYNFQGLRTYKAKFDPIWEPRYLASPGGIALPRVLTAISTLIAGSLTGIVSNR